MVFSHVEQQLEQRNYRGPESRADSSNDKYSELDIVVHPGFSILNYEQEGSIFEWLDDTRFGTNSDFSSRDSYDRYISKLGEELRQAENPIVFLYDKGQLDQYQEFIEEKAGIETDRDNTHFIQTDPDSGYIETVEIWKTSGLIDLLDENGEVTIHGEQNGQCTEDALESLEKISEALNKDPSFEYGEVFPTTRL